MPNSGAVDPEWTAQGEMSQSVSLWQRGRLVCSPEATRGEPPDKLLRIRRVPELGVARAYRYAIPFLMPRVGPVRLAPQRGRLEPHTYGYAASHCRLDRQVHTSCVVRVISPSR